MNFAKVSLMPRKVKFRPVLGYYDYQICTWLCWDLRIIQVLVTWHITNSANERSILNGSLAGVFMILFSYHRFHWRCDLKGLSQFVWAFWLLFSVLESQFEIFLNFRVVVAHYARKLSRGVLLGGMALLPTHLLLTERLEQCVFCIRVIHDNDLGGQVVR